MLTIGERQVTEHTCSSCGRGYELVKGFAYEGPDAHAIYFAACHHHGGGHEVWIDVVFGEWDDAFTDHVTFSCRITSAGASLHTPPVAVKGEAPFFGRKLTREDALVEPRLVAFWELVDHVVEHDDTIAGHLYRPA